MQIFLAVIVYSFVLFALLSPATSFPMDSLSDTDAEIRGGVKHASHWPHLTGMHGDEAVKILQAERPELKVVKVNDKSVVTMDMNFGRVRVFVNSEGKGTSYPLLINII